MGPWGYFLSAAAAPAALAAILALCGGAASAQPEPSPWDGPYLGAAAGGSWNVGSNHRRIGPGPGPVTIAPADVAAINSQSSFGPSSSVGFTGGIELGYNYRSGPWLLGFETDFSAFDINQHSSRTFQSVVQTNPPLAFTLSDRLQSDWLWTLRPRLGYVYGPWLVYATGGMAISDIQASARYTDTRFNPSLLTSATSSQTVVGWTAGAGVGYAIRSNLSIKGEWLYVDLGSDDKSATTPDGFATFTSKANARANILRIGIDYKF